MINAGHGNNEFQAGLNCLGFSRTFNRTIQHDTCKGEGTNEHRGIQALGKA